MEERGENEEEKERKVHPVCSSRQPFLPLDFVCSRSQVYRFAAVERASKPQVRRSRSLGRRSSRLDRAESEIFRGVVGNVRGARLFRRR